MNAGNLTLHTIPKEGKLGGWRLNHCALSLYINPCPCRMVGLLDGNNPCTLDKRFLCIALYKSKGFKAVAIVAMETGCGRECIVVRRWLDVNALNVSCLHLNESVHRIKIKKLFLDNFS